MCNPAAFVGVIGLMVSATSAVAQQNAANKRLTFQKNVAENSAKAAEYEGQFAKEQSREEAARARLRTVQFVSKQRAAQGGSGIAVDEGTFLDLTLDTVEQGKLDEMAILYEGDFAAYRASIGSANYRSTGQLAALSQSSAALAGGVTLMAGATKTGQNYYNSQQTGKVA
jgi:hypothetical protein